MMEQELNELKKLYKEYWELKRGEPQTIKEFDFATTWWGEFHPEGRLYDVFLVTEIKNGVVKGMRLDPDGQRYVIRGLKECKRVNRLPKHPRMKELFGLRDAIKEARDTWRD